MITQLTTHSQMTTQLTTQPNDNTIDYIHSQMPTQLTTFIAK